MEAIKALQWGISALFSRPEWKDPNTLHIASGFFGDWLDIAEGYVYIEEGRITCKVRFKWPLMSLVLREKTLSDVGAMAVEVAGRPFDSKEVFIVQRDGKVAAYEPTIGPGGTTRGPERADPSRPDDHRRARASRTDMFFRHRADDSGRCRRH